MYADHAIVFIDYLESFFFFDSITREKHSRFFSFSFFLLVLSASNDRLSMASYVGSGYIKLGEWVKQRTYLVRSQYL